MSFKIKRLFAFVAVDEDGDEGIMAFQASDGTMLSMIGADMVRVEQLIVVADAIKKAWGFDYKIKYFTLEEEEDGGQPA